jgi:hypothetical protein
VFNEHSKENGFKRPHRPIEKKKPQNTGAVFWGLKKISRMQGESEADPTPFKACVIEMHRNIKKFHKIQIQIKG